MIAVANSFSYSNFSNIFNILKTSTLRSKSFCNTFLFKIPNSSIVKLKAVKAIPPLLISFKARSESCSKSLNLSVY